MIDAKMLNTLASGMTLCFIIGVLLIMFVSAVFGSYFEAKKHDGQRLEEENRFLKTLTAQPPDDEIIF